MQRRAPTAAQQPQTRQSPPPPTEPPLHSHSPFPSAATYAAQTAHFSRSDKSAERHTRPADIDPTRPSTATYATHYSAAGQPPPPSAASSQQPRSRGSHSSSHVIKQYDAASRGPVFCLSSPTSFLSLPTHPKPSSASLLQPFLVLQLALAPAASPSASFSLQLALLSTSRLTYSLVLSSAVSSMTLRPFGAELPLELPSGDWLNVCVPVRDVLWDVLQAEYGGVESVVLRGQCKVRRVFGMRHAADTTGDGEAADEAGNDDSDEVRLRYERRESVPVEHDFEPDVLHRTLLYSQHMHRSSRRVEGQHGRRRRQLPETSTEERVDQGRRRVHRASRATLPSHRSRAPTAEAATVFPPQWEESIEAADEFAAAAATALGRAAASKSSAHSKRATQPLPSRSLAPQAEEIEKRPSFHVPTSYQMVPYTDPTAGSTSAAPRMAASSPPANRQLQRERRNERRRTADDKPASQHKQRDEPLHDMDASAGLVFQRPASHSAAGTPLSPSSATLPSRSPVPLAHTAASEQRPRSPLHVRRPPTLIRTYTAPESIDVQHNMVGRQRRDSRGEERRADEDELTEVGMERAGTAEMYRTSPVVRDQERRLEQRQHRRSKERTRRREERRGREEDEQPLQAPQSHISVTSAIRDRDRSRPSVATQSSFAFRPDVSSAESTPTSASATSSHATSRRASVSSSSISASALPNLSGSDLSSNTVSLSSTPFASLPASPTIRSARPSIIAHAATSATSYNSAPSSRRQSVQAGKERDSGRQRKDDDEEAEREQRKNDKTSQRRSSSTSRPNPAPLPRVVEMESSRPVISFPLATAATVSPAFSSALPATTPSFLLSIPASLSAVSDESAAAATAADSRPGIASLFSSPSASVSSWPVVSTGPSSPPPFSTLRSTLPPFSFIAKLSDTVTSTPAVPSSTISLTHISTLPASVPVSSTTSPAAALRPLSSVSQPVSPTPAASADWARMTVSEDVRKGRDKPATALVATTSTTSDRGQERVLEEIEEEEVMEEELDEELAGEEEEELEAAEHDDDESTRDDSGMLLEPASGTGDASLHSDRSPHSQSSTSELSRNYASPTSARAMVVSQHLRRLSM